eukprot:m.21738 g.21738  ORF g.21738 m.21738 type:complete len:189 (+) comp28212_c0_seq1:164-730(+)
MSTAQIHSGAGRSTARKASDDLKVKKNKSAIEIFYDDPKQVFEYDTDDSDTEYEYDPSQSNSSIFSSKLPVKRYHSDPAAKAQSVPIVRLVPGQGRQISFDQLTELKSIGMEDSVILRALSLQEVKRSQSDGQIGIKKAISGESQWESLYSLQEEETDEEFENFSTKPANLPDRRLSRVEGHANLSTK